MLSDHYCNQIECKYFGRDSDFCQQLLVKIYLLFDWKAIFTYVTKFSYLRARFQS